MKSILCAATIFGVTTMSAQAQCWAGYWCHNQANGSVLHFQVEPVINGKVKTRARSGREEVAVESEVLEQAGPHYKSRDSAGWTAEGEFVTADRTREQQFGARGQKTSVAEIDRCAEAEAAFTERAAASAVQAGTYRSNDWELVSDADLLGHYDIEGYHTEAWLVVFLWERLANRCTPQVGA